MRDQEKALLARMDAIRSGEGMPDGYNASTRITALLDEKARLVEAVQNKRGDLQSANVAFKLRLAEYRCGLLSLLSVLDAVKLFWPSP